MSRKRHCSPVAVCLLLAALTVTSAAQSQLFEIAGSVAGRRLGSALCFGETVVGSGTIHTVVHAAHRWNGWQGRVWICDGYGGSTIHTLNGAAAFDSFGYSVSASGDLNADGVDDLVVGAPQGNGGTGSVYAYDGATAAPLWPPVTGGANQEFFGHSVAIIGDVNGDGQDDVLVGVPQWTGTVFPLPETGIVRILSGFDGTLLRSTTTAQNYAHFGWSVARGGDMDGDGVDDYIVGRPDYDDGSDADVGQVRVFSGQSGSLIAALTVTGDQAGERLGAAVAGGGDVNGDGVADYAYGAPLRDGSFGPPPFPTPLPDLGVARVHSGVNGNLILAGTCGQSGGQTATAISICGDVDHDGFCDVLAGAPGYGGGDGRALVWSGRTHQRIYAIDGAGGEALGSAVALQRREVQGTYSRIAVGRPLHDILGPGSLYDVGALTVFSGDVRWTLRGTVPDFGYSVALLGDVNSDGWDDIAAGSYDSGGFPSSHWSVFCGRTSQLLHQSPNQSCWGFAMAGLGDVDGDNRADIALGNPCARNVEIRSAHDGASIPTLSWTAYPTSDFGYSVANAGDLDGDGRDDVLIGAPHIGNATIPGWAYVYSSSSGNMLRNFGGIQNQDRFGWDVANAGDVDGDGTQDWIIGAPWTVNGIGNESGRAGIVSGTNNVTIFSVAGGNGDMHAGWSVAGIGDVNGDGYADVAIGEPDWDAQLTAANIGRVRVVAGGPVGSPHPVLHTILGNVPGGRLGVSLCALGDVDKDGVPDFAAGMPSGADGEVWTISGATGQRLEYDYSIPGGNLGFALDGRLDQPDSRHELVMGAPNATFGGGTGQVRVAMLPSGSVDIVGAGCAGTGTPPWLGSFDGPGAVLFGQLLTFGAIHLTPSSMASFWYSPPTSSVIDLGSGCSLYLDPGTMAPFLDLPTDAQGTAKVTALVPDEPSWAGVTIRLQAVSFDGQAPLGLRLTNGADFRFGF